MSLTHTIGPRFIRPSEVIERLKETRSLVTLTENDFHVLGVGEYLKAIESGTFIQNSNAALYVLTGNTASSLITDAGLGSNEVLHQIDIVLYLRPRDNRAQYSDQLSVWFKEYIIASLVGFDNGEGEPLTFAGDTFNATENVASYSRTYQFSQRVIVDGSDLITDPIDPDALDDFLQLFQTMTADAPDFGEITPETGLDLELQ
jgi:hypothetical protein